MANQTLAQFKHASLRPREVIWIPDTNNYLVRGLAYQGKSLAEVYLALERERTRMPSPELFLPAWRDLVVLEKGEPAFNGTHPLYTGDHQPHFSETTRNMRKELRSNCWTWLDARLRREGNALILSTGHSLEEGKLKPRTTQTLELKMTEPCLVTPDASGKGLSIRVVSSDYEGTKIKFIPPQQEGHLAFRMDKQGEATLAAFPYEFKDKALGVVRYVAMGVAETHSIMRL